MMDIGNKNWTPRVMAAWSQVGDLAISKQHSISNTYHLFLSLWNNSNTPFITFLQEKGLKINADIANDLVDQYAKKRSDLFLDKNSDSIIEESIRKCIVSAASLAKYKKNIYLGIEHFIWGILDSDQSFCDFLLEKDIDTEYLKQCIISFVGGEAERILQDHGFEEVDGIDDLDPEEEAELKNSQLERFCVLLNEVVAKPNFGIISGRDKEISHLEEILSCKVKSNAILIGEAGTGKTSIAEGLAQTIINSKYDGPLKNKKIYSLDLGLLIAGSKYRGQFEERFSKLINELKEDQDAIVFIDEIHTIIGAGGKEGSPDLANMLKPALARGEIKCIGATTSTEFKKYFEKDAALSRRFHPVYVDPPDLTQMKLIARRAVKSYEKHHAVKFPVKIVDTAMEMTDVYIPQKKFIDKAFDVIDRSLAKAKMRKSDKVEICDVASVISHISGIDQDILIKNLNKQFTEIEQNLQDQILGQDKAIQKVYDVLVCAKAGLSSAKKPLASFLFVGPTSVGKTFTAKKIAEEYFGNNRSFLQLNMSEYQEQTSISRLIGASAGYVGYDDGGILTEFVRSNPNSVILFDEIEKCNPSILNLLLQILDEASIKDNLNREIDCSGTIVVMTSNLGSTVVPKSSMGFINDAPDAKSNHLTSVSKTLSPELLARIDEVVVFEPLTAKSLEVLFERHSKELIDICNKKGINININTTISEIEENYTKLHARDIKSIFRNKIQTPVAKFIAKNPKSKKISIKVLDKKVVIS
jgi:ATP-dependent Clp protease ATP-binding subunit ClpA